MDYNISSLILFKTLISYYIKVLEKFVPGQADPFSPVILLPKLPGPHIFPICSTWDLVFFKCRCGKKQSGGYLDGIAPDGVLGLGLGEVSVPSFLAKSGVTRNTFSLCFDESGPGYIYFGDQGLSTQRTTPFMPVDGK